MPDSSLDQILTHLDGLQRQGGIAVSTEGARDWYEVMLFPAAAESRIHDAQAMLEKTMPADFVEFWRRTNGANLFVNESGYHGVGIASTELMLQLEREEVDVYGPAALGSVAVFGRVNGAGDFLAFDLKTGRVLDGVHAEQPEEWKVIAESFTEWLAAFVEENGRYYWIDALYNPESSDGRRTA